MDKNWKDGELGYCAGLVRMRGDSNVGHSKESVSSYLELQSVDAKRAGESQIQEALYDASRMVGANRWATASAILNRLTNVL